MEMSFCKCCDNMLYIHTDPDTKKLYNACKSCGNTELIEDKSQFIYSSNNDNNLNKK